MTTEEVVPLKKYGINSNSQKFKKTQKTNYYI